MKDARLRVLDVLDVLLDDGVAVYLGVRVQLG